MTRSILDDFEYVLSKVDDGRIFETFAQDLLCQILGLTFTPLGGVHDRAMDGLEDTFLPAAVPKTVYQISIEKDAKAKLRKTLQALKDNDIDCARLFYVTNQKIDEQDVLEDELFDEFQVTVKCRDRSWLRGRVNSSEGALRTYLTFLETHYHQFNQAGSSPIVADLNTDPRLYVFFRQQWETATANARLDDILADTLILFALEGTDPDKKIFLTRQQIAEKIQETAGLAAVVSKHLDRRLAALSKKPRRIRHYPQDDKYCLPFETRIELEAKNVTDAGLHAAFHSGAEARLRSVLKQEGVRVQDVSALLSGVINQIFKRQGLEFANFLVNGEHPGTLESSLDEIISETVESSSTVPKNRPAVKSALLAAIRQLIYAGTDEEQEYLKRLSNSYVLLFLLQCDPKLATYFSTLAGKLRIFVDNSILVPAISELPLDSNHRRYWNLLAHASKAGVTLLVDRITVTELASHIRKTVQTYEESYAGKEDLYLDELCIPYIDEILIRSYFYSRVRGDTRTFHAFVDQFVTPKSARMEEELIEWLMGTFGIAVVDNASSKLALSGADLKQLTDELARHKGSRHQAENDARMVLSVYALRQRDNETATAGIFGFRTWWLSNDTTTQRAVEACFGKKYRSSCHMRPDFLYNYICLAPNYNESTRIFDIMFPSLLGVNISHHIPSDVQRAVARAIKEHAGYTPARVRAKLRTMAEQLISGQHITAADARAEMETVLTKPEEK